MDQYIHPLTISGGKKASFQGPKILLKEEIKKLMFKMFVPYVLYNLAGLICARAV